MAVKSHLDETLLLQKIVEGDESAFSSLFYHYAKPLSHFIFKITNSIEITEEVIQDSFITIWLKRESLESINNFGGYIYTICRNNALAALKKIAKEAVVNAQFEKEILYELNLPDESEKIEEYRKLIELSVLKLPAQQQRVYKMSRYDRLRHQDIAKELGISQETVKKHIQLAVSYIEKDLRNQLQLPVILVLTTTLVFF